jgi:hypothetical protein
MVSTPNSQLPTSKGRLGKTTATGCLAKATRTALLFALLIGAAASAFAEVIDRIMAVVGREIILLSDVTAATRFGLIDVAPSEDPLRAGMEALIARQLQLIEVNRYLPAEPSAAALDQRIATVRSRFGSEEQFRAALSEVGMSEAQLRSRARDNLRIESYREQRFGAALQPSDEDLARYYRAHESEFTTGGVLQPLDRVRDEVRTRLIRERSTVLINEWLDTLRGRTDVQVLYSPPR